MKTYPYPETISMVAGALGEPELAVLLAFGAQLGNDVSMSEFATHVPSGIDDLPEAQRSALVGLIRSLTAGETVEAQLRALLKVLGTLIAQASPDEQQSALLGVLWSMASGTRSGHAPIALEALSEDGVYAGRPTSSLPLSRRSRAVQ